MRFVKRECNSSRFDYDSIVSSEGGMGYLWCFLSGVGSDVNILLEIIQDEPIEGGSGAFYIFTVEPNVYIGFECDDLGDEQRIIFKDDPKYYPFKTTKNGFINLVQQWVKVHKERPPGISIEETSTDVWLVKSMTENEVEHYKKFADPDTGFLLDVTTKK